MIFFLLILSFWICETFLDAILPKNEENRNEEEDINIFFTNTLPNTSIIRKRNKNFFEEDC
jgi:hypothetical protein